MLEATFESKMIEAPTCGLFVNWLYTQELKYSDGQKPRMVEYAKLWVLAERFLVPDLPQKLLVNI